MNTIINLKELRLNMDKYVGAIAGGKSFLVMRRSKPIFQMSPVQEMELSEDGKGWKTIIDFTKIQKGGVPLEKAMKALKKVMQHG